MISSDVLVLEDNALIAMDVAVTLRRFNYRDVVVCHSAEAAHLLLDDGLPRAAVLDFDLGHDTNSLAVALRLKAQCVGFVFLSGYEGDTLPLPDELSDIPCLLKPLEKSALLEAMEQLIGKAASR